MIHAEKICKYIFSVIIFFLKETNSAIKAEKKTAIKAEKNSGIATTEATTVSIATLCAVVFVEALFAITIGIVI